MSTTGPDSLSGAAPALAHTLPHDGLVCVRSELDLRETTDRLLASLAVRALAIMARIDHAAAARQVQLNMLPAELYLFGNPVAGTPLMEAAPSIAIDLPLKILVSEDSVGICWLTYNDPVWIGRRHDVPAPQGKMLRAMRDLLAAITIEAAGRDEPTR